MRISVKHGGMSGSQWWYGRAELSKEASLKYSLGGKTGLRVIPGSSHDTRRPAAIVLSPGVLEGERNAGLFTSEARRLQGAMTVDRLKAILSSAWNTTQ